MKNGCLSFWLFSLLVCSPTLSADIAVIANKSIADTAVTLDYIANIYLGKVLQLPSGASVKPLCLANDEALIDNFFRITAQKERNQLKAYWARLIFTGTGKPPDKMSDEADMLAAVSDNPVNIGFLPAESVTENVKVILLIKTGED
jgi:hypothetical protein